MPIFGRSHPIRARIGHTPIPVGVAFSDTVNLSGSGTLSLVPIGNPDISFYEAAWNTSTSPKDVVIAGCLTGDDLYVLISSYSSAASSVTDFTASTQAGTTNAWVEEVEDLNAGVNEPSQGLSRTKVSADGSVTVRVARTGGSNEWGYYVLRARSSAGIGNIAYDSSTSSAQDIDLGVALNGAAVAHISGNTNASAVATAWNPTANAVLVERSVQSTNITFHAAYWINQAVGTRPYGFSGAAANSGYKHLVLGIKPYTFTSTASLSGSGTLTAAVPPNNPTIRSSATYASTVSEASSTVPLPSGWQVGDILYIGWELTASSGALTVPSGWTEPFTQFYATGATNARHGVLRRVAQSGDTDPVIAHTSGRFAAISAAIQSADTTTPEDVTSTTDDNTGVSVPSVRAPSITPTTSGSLLLTWHAARNGTNGAGTSFAPDASETEQADIASVVAASSNAAIELAYLALSGTSATGTKTATATGLTGGAANMMGSSIAVRPAVGGGTAFTGSASLSGSGSLSFAAIPTPIQTVNLSGSGTLSVAVAALAITGAAALSGSGTLTGAQQAIAVSGAAGLSGSGTLSFAAIPTPIQTVNLSGSGTLSFAAVPKPIQTANLSGSGTLSFAVAALAITGAVALSGSGTLTGAQQALAVSGSAALSGSGTLTVPTRTPSFVQTATLSGSGTLSTTAVVAVSGSAALSGSGTLTGQAAGQTDFTGSAALSGSGTLTIPTRTPALVQTANLSGSGTLSFAAAPSFPVTLNLSGSGTLTIPTRVPALVQTANLSGSGTLTTAAVVAVSGSAALYGSGTLSFAAAPSWAVTAALSGSGTLTCVGVVVFVGSATLSGSGTLTLPTRTPSFVQTVILNGTGVLSFPTQTPKFIRSVALSGSGALTLVGSVPGAFLSGSGLLTLFGFIPSVSRDPGDSFVVRDGAEVPMIIKAVIDGALVPVSWVPA